MNRKTVRIAAVILALNGLTACGAMQDSQVFSSDFWSFGSGAGENDWAELGIAALAKGDNVQAQAHFQKALQSDPNDVYALYGLAVMYHNTGQPTRARQLYEQILSMRPQPTDEILIWADKTPQPIADIAEVNMTRLQSGITAIPGTMPGQDGTSMGGANMAASGQMAEAPQAMPQSQLYVRPAASAPQAGAQMAADPMFSQADQNIVKRFKALRKLLDQGLITQEEFVARRKANRGALLPLTSKPPATGLDRPVPSVEQIIGRLRAIGRALEMRALSPAQHMAERNMILDALMPADPAAVQRQAPPPTGLMEAADAVRRLEMLKEADLITSDEYAQERSVIESSMTPSPGQASSSNGGMSSGGGSNGGGAAMSSGGDGPFASGGGGQMQLTGFQPGVHLASYRREADARKGWAELSAKYGGLSGLEPHIERVDLGGSKGVFFRLKAGPLPSNGAAEDLCRKLKGQRQYCEPTTINFG